MLDIFFSLFSTLRIKSSFTSTFNISNELLDKRLSLPIGSIIWYHSPTYKWLIDILDFSNDGKLQIFNLQQFVCYFLLLFYGKDRLEKIAGHP